MNIIIENQSDVVMISFMNDHSVTSIDFFTLFDFLHQKYFSRVAFESVYLNSSKTIAFIDSLKMINFIEEFDELRLFVKHRDKIIN